MTTPDPIDAIRAQVDLLASPLYEGLSYAITRAAERTRGLQHTKYPHLRPHLIRCDLREHFEIEELPIGWQTGGEAWRMGQLRLEHPDLGITLRLLKERRNSYPGGTPTAGHNTARRRAWGQPLLFHEDGQPLELTELLLLWDFEQGSTSAFTLRVVHTVEQGYYGEAVKLDLDWSIRPPGTVEEIFTFMTDEEGSFFEETTIDHLENETGE